MFFWQGGSEQKLRQGSGSSLLFCSFSLYIRVASVSSGCVSAGHCWAGCYSNEDINVRVPKLGCRKEGNSRDRPRSVMSDVMHYDRQESQGMATGAEKAA